MVKWRKLTKPKEDGGWGLKNIHLFRMALAAKSLWRLMHNEGLWREIMIAKYIAPRSIEDWIKRDVEIF